MTKKIIESFGITAETGVRLYAEVLLLAYKTLCQKCHGHVIVIDFTNAMCDKFHLGNHYFPNEVKFAFYCCGMAIVAPALFPNVFIAITELIEIKGESESILYIERLLRTEMQRQDIDRQSKCN